MITSVHKKKLMNTSEIKSAIAAAFSDLSNLNEQLYDYWISELYDEDGDFVEGMWDEQTVTEMKKDVWCLQQAAMVNS
jgi:hypothetical protein